MYRLLLAILLTMFTNTIIAKDENEHHIRVVFDKFKSSIFKNNGSNSHELIDKNSLNYLDSIIMWTIHADYEDIHEKNFMEKFLILSFRNSVTKEELLQLKKENFIETAVINNIMDFDLLLHINLGKISIKKNVASGVPLVNSQAFKDSIEFTLEENNWKVNFRKIITMNQDNKKAKKEKNKYLEVDSIIEHLEIKFNKKIGKEIFDPITS